MGKSLRSKYCAIILNYNDYENTTKVALKLKDFKEIQKIIIIDNNSPNGSYLLLKNYFWSFKKIDVVNSGRNGGYAFGNNFGIKYALSRYKPSGFFICNPDIGIEITAVKEIVDFFEKNADFNIGIIGAINKNGVSAWRLPSFKDYLMLSSFIISKFFRPRLEYKVNEFGNTGEYAKVDVVSGSFFFINAQAIQEAGFFDESTFLYCEETILAYKLKVKGYNNYLLSGVSFNHLEKGSTRNINLLKRYIILEQSRLIYITKYLHSNIIKILIFKLMVLFGTLEFLIWNTFKCVFKKVFLLIFKITKVMKK